MSDSSEAVVRPKADVVGHKAEASIRTRPQRRTTPSPSELDALVHELDVVNAELNLQNETLREAQSELEESRARYADLFDFAPVGYVTLDEQGRIEEINLAAAGMLGAPRCRLLGQHFRSRLPARDSAPFLEELDKCLETGEAASSQWCLGPRNGDPLWVQVRMAPAPLQGGREKVCQMALTDVTQRVRAEHALAAVNSQLETRVAERTHQLRALASELVQTEQRERQHLAQVLHDHLQQLLVAANFKLSRLRKRLSNDVHLTMTAEAIELVGQAIDASRSLTVELSPPVLRSSGLIGALRWLAGHVEKQHGLKVDLALQPDAEPAEEASRDLLFDAARELLLNTAKHAKTDGASVEMRLVEGTRLRLVVTDRGIGFEPTLLETSPSGGGFGLFSIRERLALVDGCIEVHSAPGEGTRTVLEVPHSLACESRRPEPPARGTGAGSNVARDSSRETRSSHGRQRIRVLLADDHVILRQGLAGMLREGGEFELVGEAANGHEAIEQALSRHPDVILMDITMPRIDGIEATRRIMAARPGTKIIGLSMHNEPEVELAMRDAGAVDYLPKDTPSDLLIAALINQVRGATQAPQR